MISAKNLAVPAPNFSEAPALVRNIQRAVLRMMGRVGSAARNAERVLAVEDRIAIGPKKALAVVRCHGQRFLVGLSGDAIGPVLELAGEAARPKVARKASRSQLRHAEGEREA